MTPINKFIARKQRLYKIGWIVILTLTIPWICYAWEIDHSISLIAGCVIVLILIRTLTISIWRANYGFSNITFITSRDWKQLQLYQAWQLRMEKNPPRRFKGVMSWIVFGSWKKQAS
jgi:hypothetical protein